MARPWFAGARAALLTLRSLFGTFRRQKLGGVSWLVLVIFLLALVFAFLAFIPILSPFVYPLF